MAAAIAPIWDAPFWGLDKHYHWIRGDRDGSTMWGRLGQVMITEKPGALHPVCWFSPLPLRVSPCALNLNPRQVICPQQQ